MKEEIISLVNVTKSYQLFGSAPYKAIDNLSLSIKKGAFTVLAGSSGSGKSTLLHLIGGMDQPCSGDIFINSQKISNKTDKELSHFRNKNIGFIFQNFNLLPFLTAIENIEYPLMLQKVKKNNRKNAALEALEYVGLSSKLNNYPRQLSGGQMQRVAIARALVHTPKVIIADEPTANLDSDTGANIISILKKMVADKGVTVIIASHDEKIINEAEHQIFIKDGKILKIA